jgi:glycosyltransferase involved in cell wall biosynthesis
MQKNLYFVVRHFTTNSGSYAGFVEEVAKFAYKKGYTVIILCTKIEKDLPEYEKHVFGEVIRFKIPLFNVPLLGMNKDYLFLSLKVKEFFKNIKLNKEDIIIANTRASLGVIGKKYIMRMGQPSKTFLKNMEIANKEVSILTRIARKIHFGLQRNIEDKCMKNASGYIFSSEESKEINFKEYKIKNKPFFAPHSGVKYDELQKGKKLSYRGRLLLFVSAGEERIRKGVVYLERALPEIFEKYPDVKLHHVGDKFQWNLPEKYKKRVISVGRIKWCEMKDYYYSSDLLVSCALNEWIPNVVFEAMASGLPIVTSDLEGISEVIIHMKTGYIYRKGDVSALKKGIMFVLDNKEFGKRASKRLKETAKKIKYEKFSEELLNFAKNTMNEKNKSVNLLK